MSEHCNSMHSFIHSISHALPVKPLAPIVAKFDNTDDFEGWNCGKISTCGKFGKVCGGYNTKGPGDDITKTFDVPAGKYSVALDLIKIDSWFVRDDRYGRGRQWISGVGLLCGLGGEVGCRFRLLSMHGVACLIQGQRKGVRECQRREMLDPDF